MYPLCGLPQFCFLMRRLKNACIENVVVATTESSHDDVVAVWARQENVPVFRGTEDVLERYVECLKVFPAEYAIRITADNPLTDPAILKNVVEGIETSKADYINAIEGYPVGAGVDAFKRDVLISLHQKKLSAEDREHINRYIITHPSEFNSVFIPPSPVLARHDVRLTLDTLEDWQRLTKLLGNDLKAALTMDLSDAIARFDSLAV